ncbi:13E12 repeat family protein [Dermatobacter hominis]|uniref:13E12 repeat family protein n=1 Tax=Dermatobacter hominis TaxID=2884263 RepID=UPI001D10BDD7|nr:13E12 repeat family protein [Dermatobacter hominis]UDY35748.1 13E12 repeat family protein [Dermatobacter hominis]
MAAEPDPTPQEALPDEPAPPAEVVDTARLRWQVEQAIRAFARSQADLLVLLAPFDASGEWAHDGHDSCASWLAERHGIARSTARDWLRVSHELARCPAARQAFADGRLSYSAARAVTRVTPQHAGRAAELVEIATSTAINDLPRTLARWIQHNETAAQQADRHERETRLSVRTEADGMSVMTLVLPPAQMAEILTVVDGEVQRGTGFASTPHGSPRRSLAGQRARCLHHVATSGAGATVTREVIVHVRGDGCTMHDGTPVSSHAVASLIGGSFIRALLHDIEDKPIDATNRRRFPTARQKRVVDERHGGRCVTCGSTQLIEYDHDPPFSVSRRTVVDELRPHCAVCHRAHHHGDPEPS